MEAIGTGVGRRAIYEPAPIVEAIMAFSLAELAPDRVASLEAVGVALSETYPTADSLVASEPKSRDWSAPDGFAFGSSDGKQLVQAKSNRFSYSRLAPYLGWDSFVAEGRRTWDKFKETVGPVEISQFSVRYVNRVVIPIGRPLRNFFNVYPANPDTEELFNSVFMLTRAALRRVPGTLMVIFASEGPSEDRNGALIALDNTFEFNIREEPTIWENLDVIRSIKNETFEAQITDELRSLL